MSSLPSQYAALPDGDTKTSTSRAASVRCKLKQATKYALVFLFGASVIELKHRHYPSAEFRSNPDTPPKSIGLAEDALQESPFMDVSRVDPPRHGPLRFSNDCFWKQQKAVEKRMIDQHVDKLISKYGDERIQEFFEKHKNDQDGVASKQNLWRMTDSEFQQACLKWVAQSTDATWHSANITDRNYAMDTYFAEDFVSEQYGWAFAKSHELFRGRKALKGMVEAALEVYPDWKIRVLNTQCTKAASDQFGLIGFFTAMADVSTATMVGNQVMNDGHVIKGNNKQTATMGIAVTFVAIDPITGRWQYQWEAVVHARDMQYYMLDQAHEFYDHSVTKTKIDENGVEVKDMDGYKKDVMNEFESLVNQCELPNYYFGRHVPQL